jgi:hypothetical protein
MTNTPETGVANTAIRSRSNDWFDLLALSGRQLRASISSTLTLKIWPITSNFGLGFCRRLSPSTFQWRLWLQTPLRCSRM